jgi:hypothetical protein
MFYVYGHFKETDNSIFYIGIAKSTNRFTSKSNRNTYWKNISNKHGFYHKILFEYDRWEDCLKKEIELIHLYGRIDLKTGTLCNMTDGGEGCINLSPESKKKMSEKLKGRQRSDAYKASVKKRMTGRALSDETKRKMSEAHKKVDKSYLFNRVFSAEHRENISKGKKGKPIGVGKKLTERHKEAIGKARSRKFTRNDLENIINMYKSGNSLRSIAILYKSCHATIKKQIIKHEKTFKERYEEGI